jgi:C1A family cysteine protease
MATPADLSEYTDYTKAPGGWREDVYDGNDKPYRTRLPGAVKQRVDLTQHYGGHERWLKPVYDQGTVGTCVANSTAAAFRYVSWKLKSELKDEYWSPTSLTLDPSRTFIYYNGQFYADIDGKRVSTRPEFFNDDGISNRNALKGIQRFGVCSEEKCKYSSIEKIDDDHNKIFRPSKEAFDEAKRAKLIEYCRLDPDHPWWIEDQMSQEERDAVGIVTLARLKQCLSEGYPIIFSFRYFWDQPNWDKSENRWFLPPLPTQYLRRGPPPKVTIEEGHYKYSSYGGHSVLAVGYDDIRKRILVQNSWGVNEGSWTTEGGLFWMDYSWVTDWEATNDFCKAFTSGCSIFY